MRLTLRRFVAPGVELAVQTAARGALPLGLRRQAVITACAFSKPHTVDRGIEPTDTGDRLIRVIEFFIGAYGRHLATAIANEELIKAIGNGGARYGDAINPYA